MSNPLKSNKLKGNTKSISRVLMKSYLLTMSISLLFGVLLFEFIFQKEVNYKFQVGDTQAVNIFSYFITRQLMENERTASYLMTDEILQQALSSEQANSIQKIEVLLREVIVARDNIQSVHIVDRKGNVISEYSSPVYAKDDKAFLEQFDLKAINEKQGSSYWGIGANTLQENMKPTFYLARVIRSKEKLEPLGYLFFYLDTVEFERECKSILDNIQLEVIIKDSKGEIFSVPEDSKLNKVQDQISWENDKYHKIAYDHKKYYYVSQPMPILNGQIVGMNSKAKTNNNVSIILIFGIIINIIFIIVASLLVKRKVVEPLKYIAYKAREIGKERKFDIEFAIDEGYTEVCDIVEALYEMLGEINILVGEVREKEKLQKSLELSIINHQVKPHFLYNTLNTASILVAIEQKEAANELIKTLAKYYRACLSRGDDTITIEEELQIVKEYIKIAIIRNPNIVDIIYDIDEAVLKLKIPKITLQLLVENSIKYGIKELGKPVCIKVTIKLDAKGKHINIVVEDNGVGMQPEIINKVMSGEKLNTKSGFGLRAVIARILLNYDLKDAKDIIKIDSKCGEYTRITLKIPCNE